MAASTCNVDVTSPVELGALLDAGKGAVVTLVSGETQLAAHRAVLAARSPVFEAMFRHDTRESSSGEVAIEDVPGPVLRQLLVYCYTLRAPQLPGMALQLLSASDKYGLLALRAECGRQLAQQLTVETAAATAVVALRHSCHSVKQAVASFMKAHSSQVLMTQGWADALVGNPDLAVEMTRLFAEPSAKVSTPPPAATAGGPCSASRRQSQSQSQSQVTSDRPTAPPDGAAVSRYSFLNNTKRTQAEEATGVPLHELRRINPTRVGLVRPPSASLPCVAVYGRPPSRSLSAKQKGERLRWAAKLGSEGEVRALLAAGADVGAADGWSRWTALHEAAASGHAAVVRLLAAASADLHCRDVFGCTPLHCAAASGRTEAAAALLQLGADREARDSRGRTPLDVAREDNHQQLVEMLSRR